jgi:pimeloyl-ACP methyl ester carboxylesterase
MSTNELITHCDTPKPSFSNVESGAGKTVLLLHGSASSGAMWSQVSTQLRLLYRTLSPDLIGYGNSPAAVNGADFGLHHEVEALRALLPCCAGKFHVVGYSYGGAVAVELALTNPTRIKTLTLVEPVLFSALEYAGETNAYERLCQVREDFASTLARGDPDGALRSFIDFWTGTGSWDALSPAARAGMLKVADKILLDWSVAFAADPGRGRLAALASRTLLVRGDRSPEPMCRLVDALHALMPGSSRVVVPGSNHLLPLTHGPSLVDAIMAHLHADAERRLR